MLGLPELGPGASWPRFTRVAAASHFYFSALVEFDVICGADHADPLRPKSREISLAAGAAAAGLGPRCGALQRAEPHFTGWKHDCVGKLRCFSLLPSTDELLRV